MIREIGGEDDMEFEQIYNEYYKEIYCFVLAMNSNDDIAEEITQETFYKAFRGIRKFQGDCSLKTWLCQIAKNTYRSYLKKQKYAADEDGKEVLECKKNDREYESVEEMVIKRNEALSIYKVIKLLDEPYKEVFILRTINQLSFQEIGQVYERKEVWARVTYHRARLKIQEKLGKEE